MKLLLAVVVIIGVLALFLGADLLVAWLITTGLEAAFGITVELWGMFLLVLALNILVGWFRGVK